MATIRMRSRRTFSKGSKSASRDRLATAFRKGWRPASGSPLPGRAAGRIVRGPRGRWTPALVRHQCRPSICKAPLPRRGDPLSNIESDMQVGGDVARACPPSRTARAPGRQQCTVLTPKPRPYLVGTNVYRVLDRRAEQDDELQAVRESPDPYSARRDLYLKKRQDRLDRIKGTSAGADQPASAGQTADGIPGAGQTERHRPRCGRQSEPRSS